ncbi:hypothetical protein WB44_08695 [Synechococcus sp. WH 8020]|uniref:hypothetical protein n=1 Tax=unclassified Synechococcus TaxID=2626047 RepID=UPI0006526F9F|nr:hypothetical protein [Synechococcus sp. WH 8020]AKN61165.1 hypothetical protein WB44_08695 [Synechococcus sp. WH 8020]|tara:strand:+ start:721 stop:993 length:273 start_codon:yes stop_codon:yes gene_type:complete
MTVPSKAPLRCELCQIEINENADQGDEVLFSRGATGSRSKLWARVCQYLKTDEQKTACINQDASQRGTEKPGDRYEEIAPVEAGGVKAES